MKYIISRNRKHRKRSSSSSKSPIFVVCTLWLVAVGFSATITLIRDKTRRGLTAWKPWWWQRRWWWWGQGRVERGQQATKSLNSASVCQLYKLLGRSKPGITFPHSLSLWVARTRGLDVTKNTGALTWRNCLIFWGTLKKRRSKGNGLNTLASFWLKCVKYVVLTTACTLQFVLLV